DVRLVAMTDGRMAENTDTEQIEVASGEPFAIVLPDNGMGGYLWHVAELPAAIEVRREDDLPPGGAGAPGATGQKVFELEATQPGTYAVRFEQRRDWEEGSARERRGTVVARC